MDTLLDLLKRVASLRRAPKTSKGRYPAARAPYKPLLLLTVLRRVQQSKEPYVSNQFNYSVCLRDFSTLYGRLYGDSADLDAKTAQPFWYLAVGEPKIWSLIPNPGMEEELRGLIHARVQIKTGPKLSALVEFARFSDEDWKLVSDSDVQQALIAFLISEHFADVRREIEFL